MGLGMGVRISDHGEQEKEGGVRRFHVVLFVGWFMCFADASSLPVPSLCCHHITYTTDLSLSLRDPSLMLCSPIPAK